MGVNSLGASRFKQLLIQVTRRARCCDPYQGCRWGVGVEEEEGRRRATTLLYTWLFVESREKDTHGVEFVLDVTETKCKCAITQNPNSNIILELFDTVLESFPAISSCIPVYLFPLERRFWTFLPLGLLSLPTQQMPPGPVTRCDSRPFDDFLKVNSTASPSFRLRKPSMCSLL